MEKPIRIPADLLDDEIVCFLAERYHTTSPAIVAAFLSQAGFTSSAGNDVTAHFTLEKNEMEMMRGIAEPMITGIWAQEHLR